MLLPIIIFVVCFGGGFWAAVRFLPPLADNTVGTFAGFAVALLLGAALATVGLEIWEMARELRDVSGGIDEFPNSTKGRVIAEHASSAVYYGGVLGGFACLTYLLAPQAIPRFSGDRR
jgi:hypothetical protein